MKKLLLFLSLFCISAEFLAGPHIVTTPPNSPRPKTPPARPATPPRR